jgi:DNA invertase Pin-like site-specific DNA recombinase
MGKMFGYMRVSSAEQNESRQMIALKNIGIDESNIFLDKMSGKNFNRPKYKELMDSISDGDVLYITSIDRLGRNYEDIQDQWRVITKEKKCDIIVLDMPLLDTRRDKNLLGTFIADLVLQVLSFVAQNERENIRKRQAEGIAVAKMKGVRFGPAPMDIPENFSEVCSAWYNGCMTVTDAAIKTGMARSTFRKKARALLC